MNIVLYNPQWLAIRVLNEEKQANEVKVKEKRKVKKITEDKNDIFSKTC